MYKIGCNWSQSLYGLIIGKQVHVDYIKTGAFGEFDEFFGTMRSLRPVLLHGFGYYENAGIKDIGIIDFNRANRLLAECDSPHYGLHLAIRNADMIPLMSDAHIYERVSRHIQIFKDRLSVPLLLENIPDTPHDRTEHDHYPFSDPEKISKVLIDNDVNLLLDITHAKITAMYRGWDIYDYLKALPLGRIKEIHVNGSGLDEQGFPDDPHQAMEDEDYRLLDWALSHSHPDIVTLEYIGIPQETPEEISQNLYMQLKTINQICSLSGRKNICN